MSKKQLLIWLSIMIAASLLSYFIFKKEWMIHSEGFLYLISGIVLFTAPIFVIVMLFYLIYGMINSQLFTDKQDLASNPTFIIICGFVFLVGLLVDWHKFVTKGPPFDFPYFLRIKWEPMSLWIILLGLWGYNWHCKRIEEKETGKIQFSKEDIIFYFIILTIWVLFISRSPSASLVEKFLIPIWFVWVLLGVISYVKKSKV